MTTRVFVFNTTYAHSVAERPIVTDTWTRKDVSVATWWNLWKVRAAGWDLQDGDTVLLLDSFRDGRYLTWQVQARDVRHVETNGWDKATREIAAWAGDTTASIRSNSYAAAKRAADPGLGLAWRATATDWIDQPAPDALRVGRNGWLVATTAELEAMGVVLTTSPVGKRGNGSAPRQRAKPGQGRLDVEAKQAVEDRGMAVAKAWCRQQLWSQIEDTSDRKSWDLEAVDLAGRRRYVEVKGSTGPLGAVEVTANEVDAGKSHGRDHVMVVVHSIQLALGRRGEVEATGGTPVPYDPWLPRKGELKETRYRWRRTS